MGNFYSNQSYKDEQSEITKLNWQRGVYDFLKKDVTRKCLRRECGKSFSTKSYDPKKYCSQSCAAIVNNTGRVRIKEKKYCLNCRSLLSGRSKLKYCSVPCQTNFLYKKSVEKWKNGESDGNIGIRTKNISAHLKRYLWEKFGGKCSRCGWNEKNPVTYTSPLEIEHIDGNSENNKEENLTLLCPNCHSLTPFYKNLNRGRGRKWRMEKYIKNAN